MPRLTKLWISFFAFSAAVGVVLVSVIGWASNKETIKVQNQQESYGTDLNIDPTDPNYGTNWTNFNPKNQALLSYIVVHSFDPTSNTGPALSVELQFLPLLNLTSTVGFQVGPAVPIQIIIQQNTFTYQANIQMPSQPTSVDATGIPNNYPFDTYNATVITTASILSTNETIPITAYSQGAVQGFYYTAQFLGSSDGSSVAIIYTIRRSTTTRVFAAIFFFLMWFVSLSVFIAAMSVWFRGEDTELPLASITSALLFALPAIRNSQPGVPSPIGTTQDMVGFFWNILLVLVSAIFLLVNWILQNKRPKADQTDSDPEIAEERKGLLQQNQDMSFADSEARPLIAGEHAVSPENLIQTDPEIAEERNGPLQQNQDTGNSSFADSEARPLIAGEHAVSPEDLILTDPKIAEERNGLLQQNQSFAEARPLIAGEHVVSPENLLQQNLDSSSFELKARPLTRIGRTARLSLPKT